MGNPKEQGEPSAKHGDSRKRLRESGAQTDDDSEHVEPKLSTSHCLDAMNAKLDELLATCSEIKTLKNEICFLFVCLFVYEHHNMIIVLGDPQLAKLFWAGHLS